MILFKNYGKEKNEIITAGTSQTKSTFNPNMHVTIYGSETSNIIKNNIAMNFCFFVNISDFILLIIKVLYGTKNIVSGIFNQLADDFY